MYVCVKIHFNSLFFNENNRNYVKIIISPRIKNHVLIESKQSKTYFFQNRTATVLLKRGISKGPTKQSTN